MGTVASENMMQAIQNEVEKRLWAAADELRANSRLKSSEYSVPVLGLTFLRYADHRFAEAEKELEDKATDRRTRGKTAYQAHCLAFTFSRDGLRFCR